MLIPGIMITGISMLGSVDSLDIVEKTFRNVFARNLRVYEHPLGIYYS